MTKGSFNKIMTRAKKINALIKEIQDICNKEKSIEEYIDPSPFWLECDCIPQLKKEYGGELFTHKWFDDGTFDADLTIDGVRFSSPFVSEKEREKYV